MAASLLCSAPSPSLNPIGLRKSPFLSAAKPPCSGRFRRSAFRGGVFGEEEVPKQFREENLKDGLIQNFKNVPQTLYGLPESTMRSLFMKGDNHLSRMVENIPVERLTSSSWSYPSIFGNMDGLTDVPDSMDKYYMEMEREVTERYKAPKGAPDLPSALTASRIVYLGMPIVPEVTEFVLAQLLFMDYVDKREPIYLYINSTGTQEDNEIVGSETDATAIADAMDNIHAPVYTMNICEAHGQAAMLLARGKKGHRGIMRHSIAKLHLPSVYYSSGFATDMWTKADDLDANKTNYLELLSEGVGKSKEELERDLRNGPKYLLGTQMIEYGIADKLITTINGKKAESRPRRRKVSPELAETRRKVNEEDEAKLRQFGFNMPYFPRKQSPKQSP